MEWDFVEYLLEAIKIHDLTHTDSGGSNSSNNNGGKGGNNKKMESWNGPTKGKFNNHNKINGRLGVCFQVRTQDDLFRFCNNACLSIC